MNLKQNIVRRFLVILQVIAIACVLTLTAQAAGELDTTFNPALVDVKYSGADYTSVNRIVIQPDGKVLVAGFFQVAGKLSRSGIARLNADGTIDTTFNPPVIVNDAHFPRFGGNIYAVAVQPNGKILIGGDFSRLDGLSREGIARLNADGSVDTTFDLGTAGATFGGAVLDIKVGADGKITFAGAFTYYFGSRFGVARVFSDGSIDFPFTSPAGFNSLTVVRRVELLPENKTLISGVGANTSTDAGFIYRLNSNGLPDATFSAVATGGSSSGSNAVTALRVQSDGKFLAGGSFNTVNGFPIKGVVRFNADGTFDTNFNHTGTGNNAFVYDIELLPGGMILVGGNFTTYNGVSRNNVALLNANGNLENSLVYNGMRLQTKDIALLPDGRILVGGEVHESDPNGELMPSVVRLNANGSVDTSFSLLLGNAGRSNQVFVQSDGKILIGGLFTHTDNQRRFNIARVNADGTLDTTFMTEGFNREVGEIDVRADGKILIATAQNIQRLSANGALDFTINTGFASDAKFLPGGGFIATANLRLRKYTEAGAFIPAFDVAADSLISKIILQPDGKFIVAGYFTTIAGATRGRIARINADGTLDATFNPAGGASNTIFDAVLQPDGKIIVGGDFAGINFNTSYKYLARLNADGSLDTSFNPVLNGAVQSLKLQPNGKILVGGVFNLVNGVARTRIARLNADGSTDATFNPIAGADSSVWSIDLQANGSIIIGGWFTRVNNIDRLGVARLLNTPATKASFDFDGDGRADLGVFRPSNGAWYTYNLATNTNQNYVFGRSTDKIVPADYDGDGRTDIAVFRDGTWHIQRSTLGLTAISFGASDDIAVPADYDGDGRADVAVFRPGTGVWYLLRSTLGFTGTAFGQTGDKPVPADYDGDGRADIAVFRGGTWYLQRTSLGFTGIAFGEATDKPVFGDYDADGRADIAVFRPSNGTWYLLRSTAGFTGIQFGLGTDSPVPADYDGDGRTDVAVFRDGNWYLNRTTAGFIGVSFGTASDKPIANAFVR